MVGFNFAPVGWAVCDGSLLSIAQNDVLFNLIGTTYGGDGVNTFALPDLRSRVPVHQGSGFVLGQKAGQESVGLAVGQLPQHTHIAGADANAAVSSDPAGNVWAASNDFYPFAPGPGDAGMSPQALQPAGNGQSHDNMLPFLTINFIISLFGIFPTPG